jgi:hypothetical protein
MIYDYSQRCKNYKKEKYTKEFFTGTECPGCFAVGRFTLHGSYERHIVYFENKKLVHKQLDIKRIRCRSCGRTHAVMPGDLTPYRLLSLYVLLYILTVCITKKFSVLKLAEKLQFSCQYIYSCIFAFDLHKNLIHQYFKKTKPEMDVPVGSDGIVALIMKPYIGFQIGYTKMNLRPCFMCKFFGRAVAPPGGSNITIE